MIFLLGVDQGKDSVRRGGGPNWVLGHLFMTALAMTIDVLPCFSMNKGQLIWCKSYDWAVLVVESLGVVDQVPGLE